MSFRFSVEDKHGLIELTPRLNLVSEMISSLHVSTVADIGTDHAKLPIFLIQNKLCNKVYASDIANGPLKSAKKNLDFYGITSPSVKLYLSDGLQSIPNDYDAVTINGMGGMLISDIISKAPQNIPFILNPMSSAEDLRRYLYSNGWEIIDENIAVEDRRFYSVILCKKTGFIHDFTAFDCYFSIPIVNKYGNSNSVHSYIEYTLNKLQQNYEHKLISSRALTEATEIKDVLDIAIRTFSKGE